MHRPDIWVPRPYELHGVLKSGTEAAVVIVRDRLEPAVDRVLKIARGRPETSPRAERLLAEYRLLASLAHPGIVRPLDFGIDLGGDATWLLLERAEGITLDRLVPRSPEDAADILVQICRALTLLHARGLLHLDLKPGNILFDAGSRRTTIVDFDLASTPAGARGRGTPPYASPEVMGGDGNPDARSDLFSLGVLLHVLLGGEPPSPDRPAVHLDAGAERPEWVRSLARRLTASDPAERPPNARAVIEALRAAGPRFAPESAASRRAVLAQAPLTGRDEVLERVLEIIPARRAHRARTQVAVLAGPPGVGRSRVAAALAVQWRAAGVRVIEVRPEPGRVPTLSPILRLVEKLAALEGAAVDRADLARAASSDRRDGFFDRLVSRVLSLARPRRTVLVVEDVHRLDQASREFLLHLLRRLSHETWETRGRAPAELLLTVHPGYLKEDPLRAYLEGARDANALRMIEVRPLDAAQTAELVRRSVHPEAVPAEVLAWIHERTGGLPSLVRELLLSSAEHPHGSGTLLGRLKDGVPESRGVESLADLVRTRVEQRPPLERRHLEILALLVRGAEASVLEGLGIPGVPERKTLERLVEDGLVVADAGRWMLADATTRDVVQDGIAPPVLAAMHTKIARVLSALRHPPEDVVLHELRGGEPIAGARSAFTIVPALRARGAEEEAVLILEEVRRLQHITPFLWRFATLELADSRLARGHVTRARGLVDEAMKRVVSRDPGVERRSAALHAREGNLEAARSGWERLAETTDLLDASERVAARLDLAEALFLAGRTAEVRALKDRLRLDFAAVAPLDAFDAEPGPLEAARPPRFPWPGAAASALARYLALAGDLARGDHDLGRALRYFLAVMRLRARLGDLVGLGRALHGIGTVSMAAGQSALAERYFQRAVALREETGDLAGVSDTANNLGVLLRKLGRTSEAIDHFRKSLRLRKQIGHVGREAWSYINIANVHYDRYELVAATRYLKRALEVATRLSDTRSRASVLNNLGAIATLRDRYRTAALRCREAIALDRMVGNTSGALLKRVNLADIYGKVGDDARARRILRRVVAEAERRDDPGLVLRARIVEARGALQNGRAAAARRLLERLARTIPAGERELAAEFAVEHSRAVLLTGDPARALAVLPATVEGVSPEAAARLAVARARALLATEGSDLSAAVAEVEDGERFAERVPLPSLRLLCARTRAALRAKLGDLAGAQAAFAAGYAALESLVRGIGGGRWSASFVATRTVRDFVEEVEEFAARLSSGAEAAPPAPARASMQRLREALFAAQRRVAPSGGLSGRGEEVVRRMLALARTLRSTAPLDELLREIVDAVVEFSGAERGFLITIDDQQRLRIPVARDRARERIPRPDEQISRRIVNEVQAGRRSVRIVDALAEGSWAGAESVVNLDLRSIMCAPLFRGDRVIGLLYVDNRSRAGRFGPGDLELLDVFATQIAIALENARLVREFARDEKLRVLGNLAGGVAHDFNNLLAAIGGRAQDLLRTVEDDRVLRDVRTIYKASQDAAGIVRRMQDFTRLRRDGGFERVALRETVEDVLEFTRSRWESEARRRGRTIVARAEVPKELCVRAHPVELREVLTNLVLNAVSAMPDGGTLGIEARGAGERVEIVVFDTGLGMTEEVRESLFDPFFTTRGKDGMGLGMSIVYGIVIRHQGTIRVESAPGEGTRIVLSLPAAEATAPASAVAIEPERTEAAGAGAAARTGRVLVVDDDDGVRELLHDVLARSGFDVRSTADSGSVQALLSEQEVDVVITDLAMRPLTGFDVARVVKDAHPRVGIVLVTGWADEVDADHARRHRIDQVLTKPFDIERVVGIVGRLAAGARVPAS